MWDRWYRCLRRACLLMAVFLCCGCAFVRESPQTEEQTATALPNTPAPTATPVPTRTPSVNDCIPTVTPKITFVPIPTDPPEETLAGSTPEPTPEWATPYPAPTGAPLVEQADEVLLGTVQAEERGVYVRKKKGAGKNYGTAHTGEQYAVLGEEDGYVQILFQGMAGYLPAENIEIEQKDLHQTGVIRYRIGTLNVHGVRTAARLGRIAALLQQEALDIVGIQEIDKNTVRGNGKDWTKELAKAAGYPYYAFCPATDYDEGQFGTAILSRYPIIDADAWKLDVVYGKEPRALGYARVLLNEGAVYVFNTHLCASKMYQKSVNIASLAYTLAATGVDLYTVTGDFNCSPPRLARYMPDIHFANMDQSTFGTGARPKIIDNILYSDGLIASDVHLVDTQETQATDHALLVATFYIPMPEE